MTHDKYLAQDRKTAGVEYKGILSGIRKDPEEEKPSSQHSPSCKELKAGLTNWSLNRTAIPSPFLIYELGRDYVN